MNTAQLAIEHETAPRPCDTDILHYVNDPRVVGTFIMWAAILKGSQYPAGGLVSKVPQDSPLEAVLTRRNGRPLYDAMPIVPGHLALPHSPNPFTGVEERGAEYYQRRSADIKLYEETIRAQDKDSGLPEWSGHRISEF